jgi:hypothetical protein
LKVRTLIEGAGASILLLASCLRPPVSPHHLAIYHSSFSPSPLIGALAIDLTVVTLLFAVVLVLMDRYQAKESGLVWAVFIAFLATLGANFGMLMWSIYRVDRSWAPATAVYFFCSMLLVALLLWRFSPRILESSVKVGRFGLALFGWSIFWMLPQLVYTAIRTHAAEENAFNRSIQKSFTSSTSPRVIWVLLDELSYDQVYEHRQPDVHLPHFDALKRDSVVFSDVQPAGYYTDRILPSLFAGQRYDRVRSSLHKDLSVHNAATSQWQPFDQQASIFGDAKRLGWTTGIAGWYNPYCHILRDVLDSCYWQTADTLTWRVSDRQPGIFGAISLPFDQLVSSFNASDVRLLAQGHIQEYEELSHAADALIKNKSIRFVFLHLPVPHPPGIYNRQTNTLSVKGTYLDNLVLADRTIGNLLAEIQQTEAASQTTLIVSSDHSWRVGMWRGGPSWSAEEERASGGKFDPRPFLLIHFPGSNAGELQSEPFPELLEHNLIEAILRDNLHSELDLSQWIGEHNGTHNPTLAGVN